MAYVHLAGPHSFHEPAAAYLDLAAPTQHHHHHHHYSNPPMHDSSSSTFYNANLPPIACDIKPRLTKEQHDILESHYQQQNKPNTNTKKGFAETLNVSLDKVNNWFQNRRAKAKQDAKKLAGAYNLFAQPSDSNMNFSSDSDASPSFASTDYFAMMRPCTSEEQLTGSVAAGPNSAHFTDQRIQHQPYQTNTTAGTTGESYTTTAIQQSLGGDMFDSPQELNRRTLTQEQFDAFAQHEGMMDSSARFDHFHGGLSNDADVFQTLFPEISHGDLKQQDVYSFSATAGAPLPSNDSSVPSTISEHSIFPSSNAMQEHRTQSANSSSDWTDSRSSSISIPPGQDHPYSSIQAPAPPAAVASSQWQPGQSVPVDPNELQQQFREAAQRSAQQHQHQQQQQQQQQQQFQQQQQQQQQPEDEPQHEQPPAWPADEAFVRRESHNSTMLAQQMRTFAIQTPQPPQSATFKTPAPPGEGIAARRQRPRPAALGLASLRSQSYNGAAQPGSPGQQPQNLIPGQQLRRIRSSNVIGGVAPGRVTKPGPGSAQRSPMNWTFADSLSSPKAVRHTSAGSLGNLAPPTPLSPTEQARSHFPPWQSTSSSHFNRHESISETDAEHDIPHPANRTSSQHASSPPHTPLFHTQPQQQQQQHQQSHEPYQHQPYFPHARVGSNVITENTPPQSAPAAQQTFPADIFMLPPQHQPEQGHSQMQMQSHSFVPPPQPPQFTSVAMPAQTFAVPTPVYGSEQHYLVPTVDSHPQMSMQFSNGVPMVDAQGNLTLAFPPPHMHFMQPPPSNLQSSPSSVQQQQPQPPPPPPANGQYNFVTTSAAPNAPQMTSHTPKQPAQPANEFFVHEYSPPQDIKRHATQRKVPSDSGPRNYKFDNQGPEHFEKDKSKKGQGVKTGTTSSSPGSASSY